MAFRLVAGRALTRLTKNGAEISEFTFETIPNTKYAPYIFVGSEVHHRAVINMTDTTKQR